MSLKFKLLANTVLTILITVIGSGRLSMYELGSAEQLTKMPGRYDEMIEKTASVMSTSLNLQRQLEFLKSEIAMLLKSLTISTTNLSITSAPQTNKEILENISKICGNLNAIIESLTKRKLESDLHSEKKELKSSNIVDMYEKNAQKFVAIHEEVIKLISRVNWTLGTLEKLILLIVSDTININATVETKEKGLTESTEEISRIKECIKQLIPKIDEAVNECKTLIQETEKISEKEEETSKVSNDKQENKMLSKEDDDQDRLTKENSSNSKNDKQSLSDKNKESKEIEDSEVHLDNEEQKSKKNKNTNKDNEEDKDNNIKNDAQNNKKQQDNKQMNNDKEKQITPNNNNKNKGRRSGRKKSNSKGKSKDKMKSKKDNGKDTEDIDECTCTCAECKTFRESKKAKTGGLINTNEK